MGTENANVVSDIVKIGALLRDIADGTVFNGRGDICGRVFGSDGNDILNCEVFGGTADKIQTVPVRKVEFREQDVAVCLSKQSRS